MDWSILSIEWETSNDWGPNLTNMLGNLSILSWTEQFGPSAGPLPVADIESSAVLDIFCITSEVHSDQS